MNGISSIKHVWALHIIYANVTFYDNIRVQSPIEEVPTIIYELYMRVAKYTLCDVACRPLFVAVRVRFPPFLTLLFLHLFCVLSCPA